jgi:hypothetical protein
MAALFFREGIETNVQRRMATLAAIVDYSLHEIQGRGAQ